MNIIIIIFLFNIIYFIIIFIFSTFSDTNKQTRSKKVDETIDVDSSDCLTYQSTAISTSTSGNRKKKKKRGKNKKMEKEKENSLPIAQSTLINSVIEDGQCEDAPTNNKNKTLDISELQSADDVDGSSISSINTIDLKKTQAVTLATTATTTHNDQTTKTVKMAEEKVC